MRSSCTQENLRSPSVLGSGRPINPVSTFQQQQQHQQQQSGVAGVAGEDDEVATEYAESDVLLGGTGSNGSSSGAGSAAANNIPRY